MYDALNDLILFGSNSCNNARSLMVKIVDDMEIPTLKLAYPTTQKEIIDLISKTNDFLRNFKSSSQLDVDLRKKRYAYPFDDFKKILNNTIF